MEPNVSQRGDLRRQWHQRTHSTAQSRAGRRTVLIVDDDRDARDTLAILLTLSGHFHLDGSRWPRGTCARTGCAP